MTGDGTPDADDVFCVPAEDSLLIKINGCFAGDGDWDGPSYKNDWPGTNPDPTIDAAIHPSPVLFTSPLANGDTNYSDVVFEADLPRIEAANSQFNPPFCNRTTGADCVNPPAGAAFYPFYSTRMANGTCTWQEGGKFIPGTINDFGGSSTSEYGPLLLTPYPTTGKQVDYRYNNFQNDLHMNSCPTASDYPGAGPPGLALSDPSASSSALFELVGPAPPDNVRFAHDEDPGDRRGRLRRLGLGRRVPAAGHDVVVLDDLTTGHRGAVPAGARSTVGTYADADALGRLLATERIEAILHCAARSLVGESIADPARYFRDNVAGGIALLEAARAARVERIVFSSTAAVYGIPDATPIPEDAPLRPINPYGESKRTFESALAWYGRAYGLRSVSLRYFNVAGATETLGEDHDPETHLIPNVLPAAEGGSELTIFGDDYPTPDGTCIRDYIHVADLADAHLRAIEATAPGDPRTDEPLVCNLGNGDGFSVREVIAAAEAVVGSTIPYDRRPAPARRSAGPRRPLRPERRRSSAGDPIRPTLDEMVGSAWRWRQAIGRQGYPRLIRARVTGRSIRARARDGYHLAMTDEQAPRRFEP